MAPKGSSTARTGSRSRSGLELKDTGGLPHNRTCAWTCACSAAASADASMCSWIDAQAGVCAVTPIFHVHSLLAGHRTVVVCRETGVYAPNGKCFTRHAAS
jgi:hypothetical protein